MFQKKKRLVLLPFALLTLTFVTPAGEILKLSYVRSGRLWMVNIYDYKLIQVDTDGNIKDEVKSPGEFCVTEDDALLYTSYAFEDEDDHALYIKKKTSQETVTLLKTEENENVWDIYSSHINGHILVLIFIFNDTEPIRNSTYLLN